MKKIVLSIISVLLVFIVSILLASKYVIKSEKILSNFNIISVDNIGKKYFLNFEDAGNVSYYQVLIYDDNNRIFYNKNYKKNVVSFNLDSIKYNDEYKLMVIAYDSRGESVVVNNPYVFSYNEPTFSTLNSILINNDEDYNLVLDGDLVHKKYFIEIKDSDSVLKRESITRNEYVISKDLYEGKEKELTINLYNDSNLIASTKLYNNMSPVSDVKITNPGDGNILDYSDVLLNYDGGENATKYLLQIYYGKKLIKEQEITKNKCVISADFFEKSQTYNIKVSALYDDIKAYTKSDSIEFTMNEKDTLKPVYVNRSISFVPVGSTISLGNPNEDGVIYYTLDGSNPSDKSLVYSDPIKIDKDVTIKAFIKADNKNDSIIKEYNISVGEKNSYKVYLSPSNQKGNLGVSKVGYTNEMAEMNDLTNYVEKRLKENNITVYRNKPTGNINLWNHDSMYYNCDLKLAIHSNASVLHNLKGVETWIDNEYSNTYSFANILQDSLMEIYPDKDGNRGVKYANGSLGEANDNFVKNGLLVEVAHHDYEKDAKWIMENKELIGNTIADAILKYFGII